MATLPGSTGNLNFLKQIDPLETLEQSGSLALASTAVQRAA